MTSQLLLKPEENLTMQPEKPTDVNFQVCFDHLNINISRHPSIRKSFCILNPILNK